MNFNKYYTALEPFEVLHITGHKPSNTFIGASQVMDAVLERVTVQPGEELHDLVGGLFHIDSEGKAHVCRFTKPPHIFEAHYHRGAEASRRDDLLRDEFICHEDEPSAVANYRN
jgi:hypothetical protein